MHFCIAMITKDFPNIQVIDDQLIDKDISYDWFQYGGRYAGKVKLKVDKDNDEYEWEYYAKEHRNGRLFLCMLMDQYKGFNEEDTFPYLGFRDGYLRVDACRVKDCLNLEEAATESYSFVYPDGIIRRDEWEGDCLIKNNDYEKDVIDALKNINEGYICIVDVHD